MALRRWQETESIGCSAGHRPHTHAHKCTASEQESRHYAYQAVRSHTHSPLQRRQKPRQTSLRRGQSQRAHPVLALKLATQPDGILSRSSNERLPIVRSKHLHTQLTRSTQTRCRHTHTHFVEGRLKLSPAACHDRLSSYLPIDIHSRMTRATLN